MKKGYKYEIVIKREEDNELHITKIYTKDKKSCETIRDCLVDGEGFGTHEVVIKNQKYKTIDIQKEEE